MTRHPANAVPASAPASIPARAGVGLKPEHYAEIIAAAPDIGFFEVHAENYMGAGGPPHRYLTAIRERYPLSLHGVGLSIGADRPIDREHLVRLKRLVDRYEPGLFSEHLAWSTHDTVYFDDLLPVPYTNETLARVADHIDEVQEALRRQMLLENPSSYLAFAESTWPETDFIAEIARRTGCGLLLDISNVHVSATNQEWDAATYIARFPLAQVQEFHLAGHTPEADERGRPLLIDTHDRPVDSAVWGLFAHAVSLAGPKPTLIERDADVPAWAELKAEADWAEAVMSQASSQGDRHAALG